MKYRKLSKYKYQLMETFKVKLPFTVSSFKETFWIRLNIDELTITKGYCWDGASCAIDTHTFMIPSLVHDALYQLIRVKKIDIKHRKDADNVLKALCIECGMSKVRALYVYAMVRMFGGKHIKLGVPQDTIYECLI